MFCADFIVGIVMLFLPSDSPFRPEALQTSLLFSKDYGLLSFLRKSLPSEEVYIKEQPVIII